MGSKLFVELDSYPPRLAPDIKSECTIKPQQLSKTCKQGAIGVV
jgi:hypothetical protein